MPGQSVPFLAGHQGKVAVKDFRRIGRLIADLDSDDFAVREKATRELESFGRSALPALQKVLRENPSAEVRQRVESLLEKLSQPGHLSEELRVVRAVEVLEHIGTAEVREVLKVLARGTPQAPLTREAKASLDRLARRP